MAQTIHVDGLNDLRRAFAAADKALRDDLNDALKEAAAPVRADAQSLAGLRIRRLQVGEPWTRMRVGQSGSMVYVAPVERGTKGRGNQRLRRPKFKRLMLQRALEPALAVNRNRVIKRLDLMLGEVKRVWERNG